MNERERVAWWLDLARRYPVQQFGQAGDTRAHDGATACTDVCIQKLYRGWTGRTVSIDTIRRLAGYTSADYSARRGLTPTQVQRAMRALDLPYAVRYGLTAQQVLRIANTRGPVIVGIAYSDWPEWRGFRYGRIAADGKPNGYAWPHGKAGKTQLSGFTGAHAVLVLGYTVTRDADGTIVSRGVRACEPNHGSSVRPERPPFDSMTSAQFERAYRSYTTRLGRRPYAIVPLATFQR